jgi:beta-galactosidase
MNRTREAAIVVGWLFLVSAVTTHAREVIPLQDGWEFSQAGHGQRTRVTVPHTWNRIGNEGVTRAPESNNYRGEGWYELRFQTPGELAGKRAFLQFDGVGAVADVWLNGRHIGRHEGAFSRFRFDVTEAMQARGENLLRVRADNSKPQPGSPTAHVIPLAGDFFIFGGLYREVFLILTDPVHVDLLDFAGPGVYGRLTDLQSGGASVSIATRVVNDASAARTVTIRSRIEDAAGQVVASQEKRAPIARGATSVLESVLRIERPRLWRGVRDPYLYRIVVGVYSANGTLLDEVRQPLGLRTIAFDADKGFFLNGEHLFLRGASMHQDRPVKGWAVSRADRIADFDLLQEMGANAVRLAHYQHDQIAYDLADARGLVTWAEIPLVSDAAFDGSPPSPALIAHARQQLTELIKQNFNHPSIALWSIANEVDLRPTQNARPARAGALLRELHSLAKELDAGRFTTQADCCEQTPPASAPRDVLVNLTDTLGYNKYFGWYYGKIADFGPYLDQAHARHPRIPIAVSEYGAGSGLSQHSDNALGGPIDSHGRPHPEEVQILYHEESWRQIRERPYLWGAFIWNMFDFASDDRNEGDLTDINEKGMVSYDRAVRKDIFYFYKANWSRTPTLHLVGRRYVDRAYPVVDVKAYASATEAKLSLNGHDVGPTPCVDGICVWPRVRLATGLNHVVASAGALTDSVQWHFSGKATELRIKAGDVSGQVTADGKRYGSDQFFIGGDGHGTHRSGEFAYELPLPDGAYVVTATFVEPVETSAGKRVFDVAANGRVVLAGIDPFSLAGAKGAPTQRSFEAQAMDGLLRIEFRPRLGTGAVLSALEILGSPR